MKLQGQNLRIYANQRVVGAALSATVHAAVAVDDITTKDSDGGWDEIIATTKSLDVTAEALVQTEATGKDTFDATCDKPIVISSSSYYYYDQPIRARKGDVIYIDDELEDGLALLEYQNDPPAPGEVPRILTSASAKTALSYTFDYDRVVHIATRNAQKGTVHVEMNGGSRSADEFIEYLKSLDSVEITLAETEDRMNRVIENEVIACDAKVVDISLNATNRQRSTYTVQLKATGDVYIKKPDGSFAVMSLSDEPDETDDPDEE